MTIAISGAVQKNFEKETTMDLRKVAQMYLKNTPARSKKKRLDK